MKNMLMRLYYRRRFRVFLGEQGFSLLEVMIAIAIIAIAFVPLLSTQNRVLGIFNESVMITEATLLAKEKLVESEIKGWPDIGDTDGDFKEEERVSFKWRRVVSSTFSPKLRRVEVFVTWFEGRRERNVSLIEYMTE